MRTALTLFCIMNFWSLTIKAQADGVTLCRQRAFPKSVPAGNYSGITWLGGNQYAVVDDKSATAGFHLMAIDIDSLTGEIMSVSHEGFVTANLPNRDEEGICYFPDSGTVFVSGEADGKILEYSLQGQPTGRQLNIPEVFQSAYFNGGFEGLTYNASTRLFWTTSENTLRADGVRPDLQHKVPNRLRLQSFGDNLQPATWYWYETDATVAQKEKGHNYIGVSGLAALDDGRVIVLERDMFIARRKIGSFVNVKLYIVNPVGQQPEALLEKHLLLDFRTKINLTARSFANYEGVCLGPKLADGRHLLILVADSQNQHRHMLKDWFCSVAISL